MKLVYREDSLTIGRYSALEMASFLLHRLTWGLRRSGQSWVELWTLQSLVWVAVRLDFDHRWQGWDVGVAAAASCHMDHLLLASRWGQHLCLRQWLVNHHAELELWARRFPKETGCFVEVACRASILRRFCSVVCLAGRELGPLNLSVSLGFGSSWSLPEEQQGFFPALMGSSQLILDGIRCFCWLGRLVLDPSPCAYSSGLHFLSRPAEHQSLLLAWTPLVISLS